MPLLLGLALCGTYLGFGFGSAIAAELATTPAQEVVWTPELQLTVKAIGTPRLSPDGTSVVYTVADEVMTAEKSEYVSQIWLSSVDGSVTRQLTFGESTSVNAKWSPDGAMLAFTSTRVENKSNLFVMRTSGGEAELLTQVKTAVGEFEWAPDGSGIAFLMVEAKTAEEEANDKAKNDFRWVDENIKMAGLYLVSLQKSDEGTREPVKLTTLDRHITGFNWSPDGATIVFTHQLTPGQNDAPTADIALLDLTASAIQPLAETELAEISFRYSPDGQWIAAVVADRPGFVPFSSSLHVYPASGGAPRKFPGSDNGSPVPVGWSADSSTLYFTEAKRTGTSLYALAIASGELAEIMQTPALLTAISLGSNGEQFSFVQQMSAAPQEVHVAGVTDPMPVRVSSINATLAAMPVGKTEVLTWQSDDGLPIEGLLTYPHGYAAGDKVPLILLVHGGPAGIFSQDYIGNRGLYPLATMAARDYAILRPNPRGSTGYGTEFRRANEQDWGGGDYRDLMTGVDKVIAMGIADPERLGVMGWSYGGYLTSWIVTQTNRFKAASAGAPVINQVSMAGTTDILDFTPGYFGGRPWEIPEFFAEHSPIHHVGNVVTPTMLQHGDADVRVPIAQSYEFYNALKLRGVPTRMLVLPRQPHGPNEPKMQLAIMQSNLDWFVKYLGE